LQVPLAGIGGYFIFAEWLSTAQITGAAIVVSSCLFIVWREFAIARQTQKIEPETSL
jgi:drug/metabolite transporter (DMT)-like permease